MVWVFVVPRYDGLLVISVIAGVQRVKSGGSFSQLGPVLGGIPQGSALGPLLFLVYVNAMPLPVRHWILLQFADDTCLICSGDNYEHVKNMLCDDLAKLSRWIKSSKKFYVSKSSVMWFGVRG